MGINRCYGFANLVLTPHQQQHTQNQKQQYPFFPHAHIPLCCHCYSEFSIDEELAIASVNLLLCLVCFFFSIECY